MIPAEVTYFALHSAFLVAPRWIAELRLESPVRAEGDQACRLLPDLATALAGDRRRRHTK